MPYYPIFRVVGIFSLGVIVYEKNLVKKTIPVLVSALGLAGLYSGMAMAGTNTVITTTQ